MSETVRVGLGARAYDVVVGPGLIAEAGRRIADLRPGASVGIVTDRHVSARHGAALRRSLEAAGVRATEIVVEPGEATKRWAVAGEVAEALIAARLERGDLVLAHGGGVIGDLAGFVAGLVRRGMAFVQMPTTLLAQVDSSVGGKTGVNATAGKNLIGLFHQPILVLADTDALDTLPEREFRAGYAEVLKYGFLGDAGFADWLAANRAAIFAGGPERVGAIARSCAAKAGIVARDETETGERALLNLGHTFGHALEAETGYGPRLLHGEGVAIGMALAFRFSARLGLCPPSAVDRAVAQMAEAGLPTRIGDIPGPPLDPARLMDAIRQDKKVKRGRLTFILVRNIGEAFIADDVEPAAVEAFLADEAVR